MTSLLEFNARAVLCRQLARLEPDSKSLWLAEAERWSRLTQKPSLEAVTLDDDPAETWCWKVARKRRPFEVKMTEAGKDPFEEFLSRMSAEAGEPN